MKRSFVLSLLVLNILLPATIIVGQQESDRSVVTLLQGGFAALKLEVLPLDGKRQQAGSMPTPFVAEVVKGNGNVLHRLIADEQGKFVFIYDLVITELESPKRFAVSARALDAAFEGSLRANNPSAFQNAAADLGSSVPTLKQPTEQQTIDDGGTVALDLLVNERLGVKVVDYVKVASQKSLLFPERQPRTPRDFAVANVELAIKNYQLYVDQQPILTRGRHNCTGALVWFHLPGRGRFIFSLVPYEGYDFRKVGVIEENKISFAWNGVDYEWISQEPIVGSGGLWNLWVLHDPNFVDIFASVGTSSRIKEPGPLSVRTNPPRMATIIIPFPKRDDSPTLQSHRSAKTQRSEPIRVVIGGAKTIGDLFPNK